MGVLKLNEIVELVRAKLSDPPNIDSESYKAYIDEAVAIYSRHRPDEQVSDITGNGTFEYSLPSGFIDDFSSILTIEYPYDADDQAPTYIREGRDWMFYRDGSSNRKIRFLNSTPSSTETIRVTFTLPHAVTATTTTIPEVDERAVVNLATALLAEQLVAEFTKKGPSTLPDATLDLRTKAQEYQTLADRYYALWRRWMGIPEDGGPEAAVAWTDYDWRLQSGRPPMTHPLGRQ